jgi:hypothetical protein
LAFAGADWLFPAKVEVLIYSLSPESKRHATAPFNVERQFNWFGV